MRDDDNKLQVVAQSQFDMLLACGYTKPIVHLTHKDIPGTPHNHFEGIYSFMSVSLFQNIVKGLQDSRVLEGIRKFPDFPRPLFVFKDQERLTAGIINKICMAVDNVLCREGDASVGKACVLRKWFFQSCKGARHIHTFLFF